MRRNDNSNLNRREFLQRTSLTVGLGIAQVAGAASGRSVSIVLDPADEIASKPAVRWALGELGRTLTAGGVLVRQHHAIHQAAQEDFCIVAAGAVSPLAREILESARATMPAAPEAVGLIPGRVGRRAILLACGSDERGLIYALLELADRVNCASEPLSALDVGAPVVEQPANRVRSVNRCFVSDVEDKPWYSDRSMWAAYLTMLTTQRFNRFSLTFGLGYDYPHPVLDSYLYFAYPFLLAVPGYRARAVPLPDHERDRNFEMLRFISSEAAARGLDFQLGFWNHAYQWPKGSHANYTIEGLWPQTHAPYCRDALHALLEACPGINGVTFRVHGESGIPEGDFAFWQTVFDGVVRSDRKLELNLHAKGMSQRMIDMALATDMPITLSPKYWAEHMGLPYQPSSIRQMEMPPRNETEKGFFELSSGARRFLRYSYGDLLKQDRRYGLIFRIWPGTERALLWGDPAMAASDARAMNFCGSLGVDLFEPLSFKGRHGSGLPGGRCAYQDGSLKPRYDWEKFLYTYRVWGRHLYNPGADPEEWRRFLRKQFQQAAPATEEALANASRTLRLVTTAHAPSAANNAYWPEMYTNMPIVDPSLNHLYHDTLDPKVFNNVSPLDPELFSQINDFASDLLKGNQSGKYSPLEVAQWLEDFADAAATNLAHAKLHSSHPSSPDFRRMAVDVSIQSSLGKFFAWKIRSGVLYALSEQTGDRTALHEALSAYRRARSHWEEAAHHAKGVYMSDVTYGIEENLRGSWLDRLPAIDADIKAMEQHLSQARAEDSAAHGDDQEKVRRAVREALSRPRRPRIPCRHSPPRHFQPQQPLEITLSTEQTSVLPQLSLVRLNYRHVNQGDYYEWTEMKRENTYYRAVIPANYTKSPYPLQYFFEFHAGPGEAWTYPGLGRDLSNQPYFVVLQE